MPRCGFTAAHYDHRMHLLAQLINALAQPLALVLLVLLVSLVMWRRRPRLARAGVASAVLLLALTGWKPLADAAMRPLEDLYAPPTGDLSRFEGIVVLGGAILQGDGRSHGQLLLGDSSERLVESLRLLHRYPKFRVVFTGGDASLAGDAAPEADRARLLFESVGVAPSRAMYERHSVNTWENATMSARVVGAEVARPWLLVTSAAHMRRSVAVFKKAGWNVTPYPVDYLSDRETAWSEYSINRGAEEWRAWAREVVGYEVYRLLGRIDATPSAHRQD